MINDTTNLFNYGFENFEKIPAAGDDLLIEDGTLLVPAGTSLEDLTFESEDEGENIRRTYRFGQDTYVGTALLVRNEQTVTQTPIPADEAEEQDAAQQLDDSSRSMIPYIIIGVLILLILLGLVLIIVRVSTRKKR